VVVALGHTDASPEQIDMAVEAGAELSTHLGNGCPQFIHRHRAPLWTQLASYRLHASMICDTFHLPQEVVKVIHRCKGIERCILITDAVHVAALAPGQYSLVGTPIELLPSGQVVTLDRRSMAGSALSMNRAVGVFMQYAGVSLEEALRAATTNPAHVLKDNNISSQVAEGESANQALFKLGSNTLQVELLLAEGEIVYQGDGSCLAEVFKERI